MPDGFKFSVELHGKARSFALRFRQGGVLVEALSTGLPAMVLAEIVGNLLAEIPAAYTLD